MKRIAIAMALIAAPVAAVAGTTGGLSGSVLTDWDGLPIANATVRVTSSTQVATTRTDSHGSFSFVSLTPDVYTVTIEREGFQPWHVPGVPVFADSALRVSARLARAPQILSITHVDIGSLVKPHTVADVYAYGSTKFANAPQVQADYWTLRMTPGITFGSAAPVAH